MRSSQVLIATLKETPADAEIISHQLMLRAGLVRRLASGLYTWLPMGLKVLRKAEAIVREEMDSAGAQELLMPSIQPAELWQKTGRWSKYGPELLRLKRPPWSRVLLWTNTRRSYYRIGRTGSSKL